MNTKELRQSLNLTQDQFAVKLGVAPFTVRRWESGKHKPSPMAKKQIARVFKVKVD